jgi:hypothetical protein
MKDTYYLLVAYQKRGRSPNTVIGLILESDNKEKTVWRRIGAFRHIWSDELGEHDAPLEDYPEFADWDPENFERHTVTII